MLNLLFCVLLILLCAGLLLCAGIAVYAFVLMKKRPPLALYEERRRQPDFIPLSQIPERMVRLLLEMEDNEFYSHRGFSPGEIRSAVKMNFRAKKVVYGGSTITQQLAKNLYFDFTHHHLRKAAELLIALEMERKLGKDRILELYMNIIYYGNGVYGISDAARFYFGKPVEELTVNQMFMFAVLPTWPTKGNPIQYPDVFERCRNKRLNHLMKTKPDQVLTREEADAIYACHADCLDPELRKPDDFTRSYPKEVPLINERFGPHGRGDC